MEGGAGAGGAVEGEAAAERFDAVGEADQAGTSTGGGTAAAVVADGQVKGAVARADLDGGGGSVGVFGGVGKGFGDGVVGGGFGRSRQPDADLGIHRDRDGGAAGQRLQCRA